MILNPGTLHSNLDLSDYPTPGSSPASISNDPAPLV